MKTLSLLLATCCCLQAAQTNSPSTNLARVDDLMRDFYASTAAREAAQEAYTRSEVRFFLVSSTTNTRPFQIYDDPKNRLSNGWFIAVTTTNVPSSITHKLEIRTLDKRLGFLLLNEDIEPDYVTNWHTWHWPATPAVQTTK